MNCINSKQEGYQNDWSITSEARHVQAQLEAEDTARRTARIAFAIIRILDAVVGCISFRSVDAIFDSNVVIGIFAAHPAPICSSTQCCGRSQ